MLVFREDQTEVFRQEAEDRFIVETTAELRAENPAETLPLADSELHELVSYTVIVCASYGIESEACVCAYAHLALLLGRDFDQEPEFAWAREILDDDDFSEEQKVWLVAHELEDHEDDEFEAL